MKVCTKCGFTKELDEFCEDKTRKDGRYWQCKKCTKEYNKEYRKANRVKIREYNHRNKDKFRKYDLKRYYNITSDQYEQMLICQDYKCAICHRPETSLATNGKTVKLLAIDHNHETGKIRGLLCTGCNTALGKFGDSVDMLYSAINYLKSQD